MSRDPFLVAEMRMEVIVNPRNAIASALLAAHLAGEAFHSLDAPASHPAPPGSPLHLPHSLEAEAASLTAAARNITYTGGGSGFQPTHRIVEIRTGNAPSHNADADSGARLATLIAFMSTGPEDLRRVWAEGTAESSGTAGHFRIKDKDRIVVFQGDITTGGRGHLNFDNTTLVAGGKVLITYAPEV